MSFFNNILKLVATINFSDNPKKITYDTIQEYLAQNEVDIGEDLGQFIDSLEKGLKYLVIAQGLTPEELEKDLVDRLEISEKYAKQIMQFWQKENHFVFDMIQRKGTQYNQLEEFNWSVNLKTYGKTAKNLREATAIFDLKLTNFEKSKNVVFELNKDELEEFIEELDTIEASLNNILSQNVESESS